MTPFDPLTAEELERELDAAIADIENGDYISADVMIERLRERCTSHTCPSNKE